MRAICAATMCRGFAPVISSITCDADAVLNSVGCAVQQVAYISERLTQGSCCHCSRGCHRNEALYAAQSKPVTALSLYVVDIAEGPGRALMQEA